ncbi:MULTISPECIES: CocE/NonD family hydrolase [Rhodococcus]|uniref:CocE/NonD family hydrolase n=1 Tax=Rhodococcus oxybenzonivorans TaxID=1990687 RepID=A0AAE5A8T5_9NOCA|nr:MULTISPECIES: CocE/NonD family hydrolase [Rhodococcus]MDV7242391.1 CocE/NonD family hydrolase [Rhodococcus oxybenzonivorans]MDV7268102.1 CocE/NonD family hydrolase [Rhodococcus oxybenzonivorans]MDV7277138.1 CocE/NonD family hydrolase [Rhodococcus oxybenzonivorans]MDV7331880.1 CocE/NonD family hydrolase [Rhodococcus oxybenzonivorans]MDV7344101.1 CocE/NonD family hydrolase [Rhodococcus oxybenzonivorans]
MQTVTAFPREVRTIENTFITMPDGARLAARIWLPVDADTDPVPAVLEYLPYRKRDSTRGRDALNHPYIAGHGYACVRVDMRGSGDSDGVLQDEYLPAEHDDACEVIAWLARQPWCDGNVGMMGISWGGFNSLQVASQRPPALKAIISASATEDLYVDNMHYMGGCLLSDNLSEATVMFAFNSLPPDPAIVGDSWREMWLERLRGSGLWIENWLEHQHRDDYWKRASVNEDYSAVRCPVLAVGGWADGYTNAIFRLMEHLDVPRKGLIGPWGHKYPHLGVPGPAIDFLAEVVRWWDHWLKGIDNGVMDEPMVRAWMQNSVEPNPSYAQRPGRWVAEPSWPSPHVEQRRYTFGRHILTETGAAAQEGDEPRPLFLQSPMSVGMFAGKWASYAATPDLPSDQREEDGGALVFETESLDEPLEILGLPEVELEVSSDTPVAMLAARLSDVAPNGEATRVTYGVLNLTHRDGSEHPAPLAPGRKYRIRLPLNGAAQVFPAGHRVRLSLSTSYFPLAWPPPEPVTLTVSTGGTLVLPVRPPRDEDDARLRDLGEPRAAEKLAVTRLRRGEHHWRTIRDLESGTSTLEIVDDQGSFRIDEIGTVVSRATREWFSFRGNDVNSARGETQTVRRYERNDWRTEVRTRTVLTSTATDFVITADLDAFELDAVHGDRRVYSQNWHRRIPRQLV